MRRYGAHDAGAAGRISIGNERQIDPDGREAVENRGEHAHACERVLSVVAHVCVSGLMAPG